ncbi:MAG: MFS transporter [Cyanobacteria bacterium P01_H01_bin.15]
MTAPSSALPPESATSSSNRGLGFGLCLALYLVAFNISVIPPIMPLLVKGLDSSVGYVQGALVLISLVTAAFTPTSENLGRHYGRKPVFIGGLILFLCATAAAIASPNISVFVLTYSLVGGLAATPLVSTPWAWMERFYGDSAEKNAFLSLTLSGVFGSLSGSLIGGALASQFGWRAAFLPEFLLVVVILLLVRRTPKSSSGEITPTLWVGGCLSFAGLALILFGTSLGSEYGWWRPKQVFTLGEWVIPPFSLSIVPPLLAAGLIFLGLYVYWQQWQRQRGQASLFRVGLLQRRTFQMGLATSTLHAGVSAGLQFNLFQFLPAVAGSNPLQTALTVIPYPLTNLVVLILSIKVLKLEDKFPSRWILQTGLVLFAAGIFGVAQLIDADMGTLRLVPVLMIMGVGSGLVLSQVARLTYTAARPGERSEASGVYRPSQNLGQSLGRAVLGSLLIAIASIKIVDQTITQLGGVVTALQRQEAITTLEQVFFTFDRAERQDFFQQLSPKVQEALGQVGTDAAVSAMGITLQVAFVLTLIALGFASQLPKYRTPPEKMSASQ